MEEKKKKGEKNKEGQKEKAVRWGKVRGEESPIENMRERGRKEKIRVILKHDGEEMETTKNIKSETE